MSKNPLVYSHSFLGQVEHGSHGYKLVCLQEEIGMPATRIDCNFSKSKSDIILDNDSDDTNKETKGNKSFLKRLRQNIYK